MDVLLRHLLFPCCLFLIISSAIAQDPESGYIFDEIGYGYTPVSNTPVSNSSCSYVVDGTTLMPVRRDIQRCDADKDRHISVRPTMTSGVTLPLFTNPIDNWQSQSRLRLIITYWVNNLPVHVRTTNYVVVNGSGPWATFNTSHFNDLSHTRWISSQSNHNVRTTIQVQAYHWYSHGFWGRWKTSYNLATCHSTVSNVDGTPDFSVIAGDFVSNVSPNHYEVCGSDVQISTNNTCNGGFNLFVAEIDQNWGRPKMKEAERWFNTPNSQVNLQQFTNGAIGNPTFAAEGSFTMTGGLITHPNVNAIPAGGIRYFMIQVGVMAPNWSVTTKVVRIQNCLQEPGDTNPETQTIVYEIDEFMDSHPELEDEVKEMIEEFIVLFPNPTDGFASLRYNAQKGAIKSLMALDQNGSQYILPTEVFISDDFAETPEIDITHLPFGVYTIVAQFENSQKPETIRFVKK